MGEEGLSWICLRRKFGAVPDGESIDPTMKFKSEPVRLAYGECQGIPTGILAPSESLSIVAPPVEMHLVERVARSDELERRSCEFCLWLPVSNADWILFHCG